MQNILTSLLEGAGLALIIAGVWLIWEPLALVVGGLLLITVSLRITKGPT